MIPRSDGADVDSPLASRPRNVVDGDIHYARDELKK